MLVYVVLITYLEESSLCMLMCAPYMCKLCVESLLDLVLISIGSFEKINGLSHFGGVICFVHFTNLKMCVYE